MPPTPTTWRTAQVVFPACGLARRANPQAGRRASAPQRFLQEWIGALAVPDVAAVVAVELELLAGAVGSVRLPDAARRLVHPAFLHQRVAGADLEQARPRSNE